MVSLSHVCAYVCAFVWIFTITHSYRARVQLVSAQRTPLHVWRGFPLKIKYVHSIYRSIDRSIYVSLCPLLYFLADSFIHPYQFVYPYFYRVSVSCFWNFNCWFIPSFLSLHAFVHSYRVSLCVCCIMQVVVSCLDRSINFYSYVKSKNEYELDRRFFALDTPQYITIGCHQPTMEDYLIVGLLHSRTDQHTHNTYARAHTQCSIVDLWLFFFLCVALFSCSVLYSLRLPALSSWLMIFSFDVGDAMGICRITIH